MRLINADELRDIYSGVPNGVYTTGHFITAIDECETIDAAPVKHGQWVGDHGEHVPLMNGSPADSCSCSICGKWLVGSDEYATFGYYCPNCGAKMDLEDEQ